MTQNEFLTKYRDKKVRATVDVILKGSKEWQQDVVFTALYRHPDYEDQIVVEHDGERYTILVEDCELVKEVT